MKIFKLLLLLFVVVNLKLSESSTINYLNCYKYATVVGQNLICEGSNSSKILNRNFLNYLNESERTDIVSVLLHNTKIETINIDWMENERKWKKLVISWNRISILDEGVFDKLNTLRWLNLNNNKLCTLPIGIFKNLTNLVQIVLDNNQLESIPPRIFHGLDKLAILSVSNNKITKLDSSLSNKLTMRMRFVDFSFNPITQINTDVFNGFQMALLYLNNCNLTEINQNIFGDNGFSMTLHLDYNFLTNFPENLLEKYIIEKLSLRNNRLMFMPTFQGTKTKTIDISQNQIRNIELRHIENLPSLIDLDISYNKLTQLKNDVIQKLLTVRKLEYGGNPWQCPCFNEIKNTRENISSDRYKSEILNSTEIPICFDIENISTCLENEQVIASSAYKDHLKTITNVDLSFRTITKVINLTKYRIN